MIDIHSHVWEEKHSVDDVLERDSLSLLGMA